MKVGIYADEIVAAYGHAAGLAKRAGFEMLMIHGGHGWLINQFLSPMFNRREDAYGGCLENRCRLAVEALQAVREAVGPFFPIEFRMSGSELVPEGYDLGEGIAIAKKIEPYADIIHVSAGTYQRSFGDTHPSMFKEHGCNVYLAAEIRKHVSKPVATIGGLNDSAQLEEIIASGKADIVYMARALVAGSGPGGLYAVYTAARGGKESPSGRNAGSACTRRECVAQALVGTGQCL